MTDDLRCVCGGVMVSRLVLIPGEDPWDPPLQYAIVCAECGGTSIEGTDTNLRVLAEGILRAAWGKPTDAEYALAQGAKTLITSLEAVERERDEWKEAHLIQKTAREDLNDKLESAEQERGEAQAVLASLADVVNQELRESGEFHKQAELGEDLRPFIRLLVDSYRRRARERNAAWDEVRAEIVQMGRELDAAALVLERLRGESRGSIAGGIGIG